MAENRFFRGHRRKGSYDLFSSYNHYTPGFGGMFFILVLWFGGSMLAAYALKWLAILIGTEDMMRYGMLISLPLSYIPVMIYLSAKSRVMDHGGPGIRLDSNNFGTLGGFKTSLIAIVTMLAAAFVIEPVVLLLPEMSPDFKMQMELVTKFPPLWVSFISTCIFAPFFEEWMCRGMILRGLLQRYHPAVAISVSAVFFGLIHANIWQAVPAFLLALVIGYVYYKTGSLKLAILMHSANNALALALSQIPQASEATTAMDLMSTWGYIGVYACLALALAAGLVIFGRLPERDGIKEPIQE